MATQRKPAASASRQPPQKSADDADDAISQIEDTGFTAEEEAALDAAAASDPNADPAGAVEDATDQGDGDAAPSPDDTIAALEKQLAEAKRTAAAEKQKREAAEAARKKASENADVANDTAIRQAEEKLETDLAAAKAAVIAKQKELIAAYDSGDSAKIAEVNSDLLDAKITVTKLEDNKIGLTNFKKKFEADRERRKTTTEQEQPVDMRDADTLTDAQIKASFSPEAQAWINANPEFKTDKEFRQQAIRAHHKALGEGLQEDTPEYFAYLDTEMGNAAPADDDSGAGDDADAAAEAAAKAAAAKPAKPAAKPAAKTPVRTPSAPPSRGAGTPPRNDTSGRFKRLTAEQLEAAQNSGMKPEEYYDSIHMEPAQFQEKYGYLNK